MEAALRGSRLRAGIAGVVPRHATSDELAAAVAAAAAGLLVLHRDVADDPRWHPAVAERSAGDGQLLTPCAVEVLGMLAEGLGNKIIAAARLGISDHTVELHVGAILEKLRAGIRTEAVTIGIRQGIIPVWPAASVRRLQAGEAPSEDPRPLAAPAAPSRRAGPRSTGTGSLTCVTRHVRSRERGGRPAPSARRRRSEPAPGGRPDGRPPGNGHLGHVDPEPAGSTTRRAVGEPTMAGRARARSLGGRQG
jgi:DNA-binding CsgD family transcriptional regulator